MNLQEIRNYLNTTPSVDYLSCIRQRQYIAKLLAIIDRMEAENKKLRGGLQEVQAAATRRQVQDRAAATKVYVKFGTTSYLCEWSGPYRGWLCGRCSTSIVRPVVAESCELCGAQVCKVEGKPREHEKPHQDGCICLPCKDGRNQQAPILPGTQPCAYCQQIPQAHNVRIHADHVCLSGPEPHPPYCPCCGCKVKQSPIQTVRAA